MDAALFGLYSADFTDTLTEDELVLLSGPMPHPALNAATLSAIATTCAGLVASSYSSLPATSTLTGYAMDGAAVASRQLPKAANFTEGAVSAGYDRVAAGYDRGAGLVTAGYDRVTAGYDRLASMPSLSTDSLSLDSLSLDSMPSLARAKLPSMPSLPAALSSENLRPMRRARSAAGGMVDMARKFSATDLVLLPSYRSVASAWAQLELDSMAPTAPSWLRSRFASDGDTSAADAHDGSAEGGLVWSAGVVPTQADALRALRLSLRGDADLHVERLLPAVAAVIPGLEALGSWTVLAARELRNNLAKIERSAALRKLRQAGEARAALSHVLSAEVASGLHGGPQLADDSACVGCLWLCRFLRMWVHMWHEPRPPTFKTSVDAGYAAHIQHHQHWMVQRAFFLATGTVPSWEEAHSRLANFDGDGEPGVLRCVHALEPVIDRIEALLRVQLQALGVDESGVRTSAQRGVEEPGKPTTGRQMHLTEKESREPLSPGVARVDSARYLSDLVPDDSEPTAPM
jgi:hypothetical protein